MQLTLEAFGKPAELPQAIINIPECGYLTNAGLPGLFPANFKSEAIYEMESAPKTFNPVQIQFDIKGDPNEALWQDVKAGKIDAEKIFCEYKSLGQTVKIEGDRGIPDLNKKRALNFNQYFTPQILTKFIAQALRLDAPGTPALVADNSCGIGRMFQFLNPSCDLVGIEVEEKAYHMARALFPKANIIHDNLINHPTITADCAIINPPFSIQLEKKNCGFVNAAWGDLGPGTSIKSHIAALEVAIRSARYYVAAMLPQGYFKNEDTLTFEKWVNHNAQLMYRLDIDGKAFTKYGFTWPCSIVIYCSNSYSNFEPIHHKIETLDETTLTRELELLQASEAGQDIKSTMEYIKKRGAFPYNWIKKYTPEPAQEPRTTLPLTGTNKVKICLSPDSSRLNIKADNLLTVLKIHEFRKSLGEQWNEGLKENTKNADVRLRRRNLIENPADLAYLLEDLQKANIKAELDPQFINWNKKKVRWLERQQAPFEQFIKDENGEWVCLHEDDGIRSLYPELYAQRLKRIEKLGMNPWLWPPQKDNVARMSMKDSSILGDDMGLGKTRQIIALGILYGCKHNLIVVEPKLKDEFIKEFKILGITDYQVILDQKDLKHLKKFNIIAYNLLWRPLNDFTKKTFAKAMRRRFQFIAIDEAHKIKAKDSEQAKAVRMLKARYKLLSTGTPIANYPRNIFSLLVFGWGGGTERNPYGYYSPIEKSDDRGHKYGYTTGTRQFKEDFVTIEWVSPQFEQTLDSGSKAREIPKIRNPKKWWEMMAPKIIRRQRDEPEVKKFITFPKPEISTELIKMAPEQVKHYKHWLDNFAAWFKEQLKMEREGGHKIDQMVVLAHLTQLQFASTIPQSPKTNTQEAPWKSGPTTKQQRAIEIIKESVANENKIIVFSERPEFQRFIQKELIKIGIKSHLFIGQQGIKERNILLDDFKHNGVHVLLATTTCGEIGLNIPEANIVVLADTSWTPSKQIQAWSRILRPQQKKTPKIYLLRAKGAIDEYMQQLMDAKTEAINEGIDHQEASEFDPEKWLSYKDFTIKMLKEEGYNL